MGARANLYRIAAGAAAAALLMAGCEWESSGDGDSWDDSYSWINFSGVYRAADGDLLVTDPDTITSSDSQTIGTGDGFQLSFSDTLDNTTVVAGSVSVTDGYEAFTDAAGDGSLVGDKGGTGSINYETGFVSVTFNTEPGAGDSVNVSYQYEGALGTGGAGGSEDIYSLNVEQVGNLLTITANTGLVLTGRMGGVSTAGGDSTGNTDGEVIANFKVSGDGVKIVGTFQGDYTAGGETTTGALDNRVMQATWIEDGGTGDIQGVAGSTTVTVSE